MKVKIAIQFLLWIGMMGGHAPGDAPLPAEPAATASSLEQLAEQWDWNYIAAPDSELVFLHSGGESYIKIFDYSSRSQAIIIERTAGVPDQLIADVLGSYGFMATADELAALRDGHTLTKEGQTLYAYRSKTAFRLSAS